MQQDKNCVTHTNVVEMDEDLQDLSLTRTRMKLMDIPETESWYIITVSESFSSTRTVEDPELLMEATPSEVESHPIAPDLSCKIFFTKTSPYNNWKIVNVPNKWCKYT